MAQLNKLEHIQTLLRDLQKSREEVVEENQKLAHEVIKMNQELCEMKKKYEENSAELETEIYKLNAKIENYKRLCESENKAKEHLQDFVQKINCENEQLSTDLKSKEIESANMKKDFESFMEQVCDQNKIMKETLDCREQELSKLRCIKGHADEQKAYLVELEGETEEFIKKIQHLQDCNIKYEEANCELRREIRILDKKVEKITESRNFTSATLDTMTEENTELKAELTKVRDDLCQAENCNKEYVTEIDKFDKLTATMEEQLGKYRCDIQNLEICLAEEKRNRQIMEEDLKHLADELFDEQNKRKCVETDLCIVRNAHKQCEKRLRKAIKELECITYSFETYKKNIHDLKVLIKARPSCSCPPSEFKTCDHNLDLISFTKAPVNSKLSCELLFKNSRRLNSLPSLHCPERSGTLRWRWPSLNKKKRRYRSWM